MSAFGSQREKKGNTLECYFDAGKMKKPKRPNARKNWRGQGAGLVVDGGKKTMRCNNEKKVQFGWGVQRGAYIYEI